VLLAPKYSSLASFRDERSVLSLNFLNVKFSGLDLELTGLRLAGGLYLKVEELVPDRFDLRS
jgi:hypothetical protein